MNNQSDKGEKPQLAECENCKRSLKVNAFGQLPNHSNTVDEELKREPKLCAGSGIRVLRVTERAAESQEVVSRLAPEEMLAWVEKERGPVSFDRVSYYFASVTGDQGGGFTREDAITALYKDIRADLATEKP